MIPPTGATRRARHSAERGFALAAALFTLLIASTIGTTMAELARLEAVLAHRRKATTAALAAVDACAEHVVASLPAGWEFAEVIAGSDGISGTADDGLVPLPGDCAGTARAAPGAAAPPRLLLEVEATRRRGRRRLEAVVHRYAEPGMPALLWIAGGTSPGLVTGTLTLDGIDASRPRSPRSALAAPVDPAALDAWIATQGPAVVAVGGTGAPIWAVPPPLTALVDRAAAAGALAPGASLVATAPAVPQLTLSAGDLTITSPRFGAGILVVDGELRVTDAFAFTGIVAVTGGLRVEPSGTVDLQGALWLGTGSADALVIDGGVSVVASAEAVEVADALLPLPRRAALASVRDF